MTIVEEIATDLRVLALPSAFCSNLIAAMMIGCKGRNLPRFLLIVSVVLIVTVMIVSDLGLLRS
jgi:uncharacterized membrane protein YjjB (DUF3815 family)